MRIRSKRVKSGFTLIELSFAIAFISVLLITITLITNEIVSIYRKGYSIKTVNQVGRDLIDDFQNSITQSPPASISSFCVRAYPGGNTNCERDNGFASVYLQFYSDITIKNEDTSKMLPTGGLFCSGKYTYIWNTGYLFNSEAYDDAPPQITLKYTLAGGASGELRNFHLVKVEDTSRTICASYLTDATNGGYPVSGTVRSNPASITIPEPLTEVPEEMLKNSDAALALYDFVLFEPARVSSTGRLLFSGSFILGTITGGVDIMTSSNYCKTPANFSADFNYCAINKFNFTMQASGNK